MQVENLLLGEVRNVKTFYSAEDIEALAAQGIRELVADENTVLTDLARDLAPQVGIKLVSGARPATVYAAPATQGTLTGARPKGCQHGPLSSSPAMSGGAPAQRAGNTPVVDDLVGAVRQLAGKQERG